MSEVAGTLVKHRARLNQIGEVLAHHGPAAWAARGTGITGARPVELVHRVVDAGGHRGVEWRAAPQRADRAGHDVDQVRPDAEPAPRCRRRRRRRRARASSRRLCRPIRPASRSAPSRRSSARRSASCSVVRGRAVRVGLGRAGAPRDARRRHRGRGEGPARRRRRQVREDLELMQAVADYLESEDPELAQLRPTILVDEFAKMMDAAIDLREELANLQRFRRTSPTSPTSSSPTPYPERSSQHGAHDVDDLGAAVHRSRQRRGRRMGRRRARAARGRRLPGDDLPRRPVPRRSASGELPAARRAAPGDPRLRRRRTAVERFAAANSRRWSSRSARATSTHSSTSSWR